MRTVIKYTNSRGESVTFNKFDSPFHANKVTGLGEVEVDNQTQKAPYQDGSSYTDSLLDERLISFEITILGENDTDISNKRSQLARVLNPKLGEGLLEVTYGTVVRVINAIAEHIPNYPSGNENRGTRYQTGLVDLICTNPYWRSTSIVEEPAFEPLFQFPFEGEFELGMQRDRRTIVNDGDSPAPLFVEFFGPALNPKIINNTTGEYIKINQQLNENERMLIDTTDGKKSVVFMDSTGVKRNVFNWIDLNSTFFKLEIGENDIEYTADSDIQGAVVNISYSKLYTAV
ncbi:phage tail family protein [Psychrobacillus psychrodurans]|uniref:phage tail family protein n=1 Tax=Psychrobacillus psychrodurans TaxID=126157 RepID=UPI0008DFE8E8|nr:phage tail family protein [Psychrobacillus psychrodurans]MCZ8541960.1 phage tail family protein [Psychrobacillus psychrodurans]SFN14084.1 Phage tail protein [Psychrobacillus psychrodurans]